MKWTPKCSSGAVHLQELTTRELRKNIEDRIDTIAYVLNLMLEDGRLVRRRKGKQKVLWSLAEDGNQERMQCGEKLLKTGSRFSTGSQKSKPPGISSVDRKEKTCPVENQTVPDSLPPVRARGNQFGNQLAFRRQGSAETGKPKAPTGLGSKAQSQERLPGRQPHGSVPLREDLTEWRNAETVRLIDRKPELPERNTGANRSSPAPCCVTAPISTRTTFRLLPPEAAFSCAFPPCGRCGRPGFLIGSTAFPPGISVVRATPPRRGLTVNCEVKRLTLSDGASAPKNRGRSHHQQPSRAARRCAKRGGDTRGAASLPLSAADAGNPCCPTSGAAFQGSPLPQRRGLRPLRERRCGKQDRRHVRWPPPRRKGGGPSDGICLPPRGGHRRSFQGR